MKDLEVSNMSSAVGPAPGKARPHELPENDLPLEEQIRRRANEIWLERGGQDGSDTENWLQAEQEILNGEA